jgi:hypothetical protein
MAIDSKPSLSELLASNRRESNIGFDEELDKAAANLGLPLTPKSPTKPTFLEKATGILAQHPEPDRTDAIVKYHRTESGNQK